MLKHSIVVASALAAMSITANANNLDERQTFQYGRIEEGRQDGSITWREGLRLRAEQRHIARLKDELEDGHGRLSRSNARAIRSLQNDASEDIEVAKENSHYRPSWLPRIGK
jgi:hypothetical protein